MENQPIPLNNRPRAPMIGAADGTVILHAGRYARESVLLAYEMNGGVEWMADWASKNPGEFLTKLFAKVMTREVEIHASEGIEDLLSRVDAEERMIRSGQIKEADYTILPNDEDEP